MAKTHDASSAGRADLAGELRIEIEGGPYTPGVTYEGTAAQLQAEGLTPEGQAWPLAAREVRWDERGLSYRLSRVRPHGWKGPMRSWLGLDHWALRVRRQARELPGSASLDESAAPAPRSCLESAPAGLAVARADRRFRAFLDQVLSRGQGAGRVRP